MCFCFNQTMPFCDDITLSNFRSMADILGGLNINTLDIMGGEPTLHKDIIPMLEYAGKKSFNLNLSSNGTDIATVGDYGKVCKGQCRYFNQQQAIF